MIWTVSIVIAIILVVVGILFLNRFFIKSTRESALVRTGAGGQKVVIDGGCFALPILHSVQKVTMRTASFEVSLTGMQSVITADKIRVDVETEFQVRVDPSKDGVAAAAQALGNKSNRTEEFQELIGGKLVNAIRSVAAMKTLEDLHMERGRFSRDIADVVNESLSNSGLLLEAVSLQRLDQAPFSSLDENNIFNAIGMRRLSEVISESRKERVRIESEADLAIRQSRLEESQRQLEIERQQKQKEIETKEQIELMNARSEAEVARIRSEAARQSKEAEIGDDEVLKQAEINRDLHLREWEMQALLKVEETKIQNAIQLKQKRTEEMDTEVAMEERRALMIEAQEGVQTRKDVAAAKRAQELALIKTEQENQVDDAKVRSQVDSLMKTAKAEADAVTLKAAAEREKLKAEAEGRAAVIKAENTLGQPQIDMKLELHRLDKLPEIATQMMKPVEKIDSIRINHIGGFGSSGEGGTSGGAPFNKAMESVLGMAVQLPAMKSLGAEIGMDFDANLASRLSDSVSRSKYPDEGDENSSNTHERQQGDQK